MLVIVPLLLPLVGCEGDTSTDDIQKAISKLRRSENNDNFVIIDAGSPEKYIQFSADVETHRVYLDFAIRFVTKEDCPYEILKYSIKSYKDPNFAGTEVVCLDPDTLTRLKRFLGKHGLNTESTHYLGEDPHGNIVAYMENIKAELTIPKDRYSSFVRSFFREVHLLEAGYTINMKEN